MLKRGTAPAQTRDLWLNSGHKIALASQDAAGSANTSVAALGPGASPPSRVASPFSGCAAHGAVFHCVL